MYETGVVQYTDIGGGGNPVNKDTNENQNKYKCVYIPNPVYFSDGHQVYLQSIFGVSGILSVFAIRCI